jgi:hypothetical protein
VLTLTPVWDYLCLSRVSNENRVDHRKVLGETARKRVIAEFEQEQIVDAYNAEFAKIFYEHISRSSQPDLV